ncbi:glutamine synthetase [Clostridium tetani]|uniref:glutamine synthetase n=1 Tax=Clostridium tetani TaxID=1513 RepID=A0ABY0EST8_CLOTA|nr:glutamine synthetase [Clostridium tetani]KHO40400.1 glutamine synthetase [Clostridium tetani]RXI58259.1 glutamine synthetase [Clostridium tetani]RXI70571.1 glutamine synthetase [Clostridium tetani]CDI48214.1 glutamine synthetase [Clostridium tetani 12124569]
MLTNLLYKIPKEKHTEEELCTILKSHTEIKFVSFVGIDLSGNDTDEKIPISAFLEDISTFLKGAVQTDGSSVSFPGIATLNNAKLEMIADLDVNWFIDYNYEHIDKKTDKPIGTLRIPCYFYHDNKPIDSRYLLKSSIEFFKKELMNLLKSNNDILSYFSINYDDIEDIDVTCATELEFWVKTPNDKAEIEELSTSQVLHEQYWNRTKGAVRTSLEQSLLTLEYYGLEPEMGHKEVGGVKAKLDDSGKLTHIMEQLEIDWKYSSPLQCCDNELLARAIIKETFRSNGLDVTFLAKPVDGVAGSGKHIHVGIALKLKNKKKINLFSSNKDHFLSSIGYGSLMGMLKNYEIINPFVSSTNDAFKRLKPGFEAPTCIVTSIGRSVEVPSRNRTILVGVIRDIQKPLSTRFELRSPNPHTNTYLAIASMYMCMLDGIKYSLISNKSEDELLKELSKLPGKFYGYLEKERAYRSEEDVFDYYTDEERNLFFGKVPATVYENLCAFKNSPKKLKVLQEGNIFTDAIVNSFFLTTISRWITEITNRLINNYFEEIKQCKMLHSLDNALDIDISRWLEINTLRHYLAKDSYTQKCLFTRIKEATNHNDYEELSKLQLELQNKISLLHDLYGIYKKNLLDL